jgi:hypothetical protein
MEMVVESMKMAPGAIPCPGRVPEQRLLSPEIGLWWWRRCRTFYGRRLVDLGFLHQRDFIGGRAMSEGGQGAHTTPWCGQRGARHQVVWLHPGPPLSLLWTLSHVGKIGTLGFVSSNSENISCATFLKHKNSRKQELALWHLVNMLVPENG